MRVVKAGSSKFVHENFPENAFAWQEGYGVFSVSVSMLDVVTNYINRQEEHHSRIYFPDEYEALLKKHGVIYDHQFLLG